MSVSVYTIFSMDREDTIHTAGSLLNDWLSYLELSCFAGTSFVIHTEAASVLHKPWLKGSTGISVQWHAQDIPNQRNVWWLIYYSIYLYHLLSYYVSRIHTILKVPVHFPFWVHAQDRHLILVISNLWGCFMYILTNLLSCFFWLIAFAPSLPNSTTENSVVEMRSQYS